nr:histone acetyltransferase KAT6B-like [Aegilops tauschii subsp. strangulata]
MKMLVPVPYQAPAKKGKTKKNKEAEEGLPHEETSGAVSGGTEAPSSHEGDEDKDEEEEEEEEGEEKPPPIGKKRAASIDTEEGASKRGKTSLSDDLDLGAEAVPRHRPRAKPLAESPARDIPEESSSSGDLSPEKMESETPPQASPPPRADDTEVLSQRISPGSGEVREGTKTAPGDNGLAAENMGGATLMEIGDEGHELSNLRPDTVPETSTAPEPNQQPPPQEWETAIPTATSINAEAPNMLMDALQSFKRRPLRPPKFPKRKLQLVDGHNVRINKRLDEAQALRAAICIIAYDTAEVETLRSDLARVKEQARVSDAAADKGAADLKAEQATRCQFEERVSKVEQELKDATRKCELLEEENKAKAAELAKALQDA